jgi:TonB family protein
MSRLALVTIFIAVLRLVSPFEAEGGAQQKRAGYGPVVSAYLTGLAEELNELEFQLRNREISRFDYDRAKQRLTILRRYVERLAAQSPEDLVPEIQVLSDDELASLGLEVKPNPNELQAGDQLDGLWKIIGVERARARFFVFHRIPQTEEISRDGVASEHRPEKKIDPLAVVETIIVRETPPPSPQQPPVVAVNIDARAAAETQSPPAPPQKAPDERSPQVQPPRILHVYLPQYTDKARNSGVEGELVVRALFQSDGKIKNVKIEKGLGYGLDQRAIDSVKRIGFLPAQFEGKDIDVYAQIVFNYKLGKVTFYLKSAEPGDATRGVRP